MIKLMLNQKGFTPIILIVGILILIILIFGVIYNYDHQANNINGLAPDPNPGSVKLKFSDTTPKPTSVVTNNQNSSPEAKTLEIDFKAEGVMLEAYGNSEVHVWWKPHSQDLNEGDYAINAKEYLVDNADVKVLTKAITDQNWDTTITNNNYDFSGDAAGGCGFITGYIGYKNGQLRSINVEEYYSCGALGASENEPPGSRQGVYISVSDVVNINQIINLKK